MSKSPPLKISPRPFPDNALKYQGEYKTSIDEISQSENPEKALTFKLVGVDLDSFSRKKEILSRTASRETSSRKALLSTDLYDLFYSIKKANNRDEVDEVSFRLNLNDFIENFKIANSDCVGAPFAFYKYALLEELRLVKRQVKLLEINLPSLHQGESRIKNQAKDILEQKKIDYQKALDEGVAHPKEMCLDHQCKVLKSGQALNSAQLNPSVSPFTSKIGVTLLDPIKVYEILRKKEATEKYSSKNTSEWIEIGNRKLSEAELKLANAMLSVDQFNAAESIDAAIAKTFNAEGGAVVGGKAEIRIPTGGGKTHLLDLIKANYGEKLSEIVLLDLNSSKEDLDSLLRVGPRGKTVLLDEAYFYQDFNLVENEKKRNDFIRELRNGGATAIISGASESLAKIKIEIHRIEDKIEEIESELKKVNSKDELARIRANNETISKGEEALEKFTTLERQLNPPDEHRAKNTQVSFFFLSPKQKNYLVSFAQDLLSAAALCSKNESDIHKFIEEYKVSTDVRKFNKLYDFVKKKVYDKSLVSSINGKLAFVVMEDFNSNDSSKKLTIYEKKLEVKTAQYSDLFKRRDLDTIKRLGERDGAGYVFQARYEAENLANTVLLNFTWDRLKKGEKMQYILPDFEIDDSNCTDENLYSIQEATGANIVIIPIKEGGNVKCKVRCRTIDSDEVEVIKVELLNSVELDKFIMENGGADNSIISFFDKKNCIGGDYGNAGSGIKRQIIQVENSNSLTTNKLMQCQGRDRTGRNFDEIDTVEHVFLTSEDKDLETLREEILRRSKLDDEQRIEGYLLSKIARLEGEESAILKAKLERYKKYLEESKWNEEPKVFQPESETNSESDDPFSSEAPVLTKESLTDAYPERASKAKQSSEYKKETESRNETRKRDYETLKNKVKEVLGENTEISFEYPKMIHSVKISDEDVWIEFAKKTKIKLSSETKTLINGHDHTSSADILTKSYSEIFGLLEYEIELNNVISKFNKLGDDVFGSHEQNSDELLKHSFGNSGFYSITKNSEGLVTLIKRDNSVNKEFTFSSLSSLKTGELKVFEGILTACDDLLSDDKNKSATTIAKIARGRKARKEVAAKKEEKQEAEARRLESEKIQQQKKLQEEEQKREAAKQQEEAAEKYSADSKELKDLLDCLKGCKKVEVKEGATVIVKMNEANEGYLLKISKGDQSTRHQIRFDDDSALFNEEFSEVNRQTLNTLLGSLEGLNLAQAQAIRREVTIKSAEIVSNFTKIKNLKDYLTEVDGNLDEERNLFWTKIGAQDRKAEFAIYFVDQKLELSCFEGEHEVEVEVAHGDFAIVATRLQGIVQAATAAKATFEQEEIQAQELLLRSLEESRRQQELIKAQEKIKADKAAEDARNNSATTIINKIVRGFNARKKVVVLRGEFAVEEEIKKTLKEIVALACPAGNGGYTILEEEGVDGSRPRIERSAEGITLILDSSHGAEIEENSIKLLVGGQFEAALEDAAAMLTRVNAAKVKFEEDKKAQFEKLKATCVAVGVIGDADTHTFLPRTEGGNDGHVLSRAGDKITFDEKDYELPNSSSTEITEANSLIAEVAEAHKLALNEQIGKVFAEISSDAVTEQVKKSGVDSLESGGGNTTLKFTRDAVPYEVVVTATNTLVSVSKDSSTANLHELKSVSGFIAEIHESAKTLKVSEEEAANTIRRILRGLFKAKKEVKAKTEKELLDQIEAGLVKIFKSVIGEEGDYSIQAGHKIEKKAKEPPSDGYDLILTSGSQTIAASFNMENKIIAESLKATRSGADGALEDIAIDEALAAITEAKNEFDENKIELSEQIGTHLVDLAKEAFGDATGTHTIPNTSDDASAEATLTKDESGQVTCSLVPQDRTNLTSKELEKLSKDLISTKEALTMQRTHLSRDLEDSFNELKTLKDHVVEYAVSENEFELNPRKRAAAQSKQKLSCVFTVDKPATVKTADGAKSESYLDILSAKQEVDRVLAAAKETKAERDLALTELFNFVGEIHENLNSENDGPKWNDGKFKVLTTTLGDEEGRLVPAIFTKGNKKSFECPKLKINFSLSEEGTLSAKRTWGGEKDIASSFTANQLRSLKESMERYNTQWQDGVGGGGAEKGKGGPDR